MRTLHVALVLAIIFLAAAAAQAKRAERERQAERTGRKPAGRPPQVPDPAQTAPGHAVYALRKAIVEPVLGQIKDARGFRRFSFRGLGKVQAEWLLICLTHNLLKLFRAGWRLRPA